MKVKDITLFVFASIVFMSFIVSSPSKVKGDETLTWYTDFNEANELSQSSDKPIFAFFTGSDWCGWCRKLQADVFKKESFIKWANANVVLLELDFPRRTQLPDSVRQQNAQLAQLFKVRGYPTVWIFDAVKNDSTEQIQLQAYGSLGYPTGAQKGKEEVKFLVNANAILDKKS